MTLELQLTELVSWAIALMAVFTAVVTALVKLLLNQVEGRLTERFASQDKARHDAGLHWEQNFSKVLAQQDKYSGVVSELEKTFLRWQAELPLQYVRREDYVRNQTVIEAKLDALASKLEVIQINGARQHD